MQVAGENAPDPFGIVFGFSHTLIVDRKQPKRNAKNKRCKSVAIRQILTYH